MCGGMLRWQLSVFDTNGEEAGASLLAYLIVCFVIFCDKYFLVCFFQPCRGVSAISDVNNFLVALVDRVHRLVVTHGAGSGARALATSVAKETYPT